MGISRLYCRTARKTVVGERLRSVVYTSMFVMTVFYIVILTDNVVAGQVIGEDAVLAITLVAPLVSLFTVGVNLATDGLVLLASYAQGEGDREELNRCFSMSMILCVSIGLFFMAFLYVGKDVILSFWDISPKLYQYVSAYYDGILWVPLGLLVGGCLYGFLLEEGEELLCNVGAAAAAVLNIVLDTVLAKKLGIFGIGIASAIGMTTNALVLCSFLFLKRCQLRFSWYWNTGKIWTGLGYGACNSAEEMCQFVLPILMSSYVLHYFHESYVLVVTVGINLFTFVNCLFTGIGGCMNPLVCQYYAEGSLHSIRKVMIPALWITIGTGLLVAVLGIGFSDKLAMAFGAEDKTVIVQAAVAMRFFVPFLLFEGVVRTIADYYICVKHVVGSILWKTAVMLVFPCVGFAIGGLAGKNGFWLGFGVSLLVSFVLLVLWAKWQYPTNHHWINRVLLIDEKDFRSQLSLDVSSRQEEIMEAVQTARTWMEKAGIPTQRSDRLILMMEEIGMLAVERQGKKDHPFELEFSILLAGNIEEPMQFIVRDNGEPYDILHMDGMARSLAENLICKFAESSIQQRKYFPSGDENRYLFKI